MLDSFFIILNQYIQGYLIYLPLSIIGIFRWSWWVFKKIRGKFYSPYKNDYTTTVSVVIPVYNEMVDRFKQTLNSILLNNPYEIIAVIDEEDKQNIEYAKSINDPRIRVIAINVRSKRYALATGIKVARGEIVALVDSDVIWPENTLKNGIKPFVDKSIGGVCTRQNVINRDNVWSIMTDIFWDSRNHDDLPALSVGKALSCLSGRTAFWRNEFLQKHLDEFLNEYIFNVKKESGEDKCLTRLAQRDGYKVYFQSTAQILSYGVTNFKDLINQRIRWSRNSFNSDLKSMSEGWVFKKPFLLAVMIDRFISIFTIMISLTTFILALSMNHVELAYLVLAVWFIGRTIKNLSHLKRHPSDIIYLPLYIMMNFLVSLIKLYAIFTITQQKTIRGVNKVPTMQRFLGFIGTISTLGVYALLFVIWRGYI